MNMRYVVIFASMLSSAVISSAMLQVRNAPSLVLANHAATFIDNQTPGTIYVHDANIEIPSHKNINNKNFPAVMLGIGNVNIMKGKTYNPKTDTTYDIKNPSKTIVVTQDAAGKLHAH